MKRSAVLAAAAVGALAAAPSLAFAQSSPISPQTMGRLDVLGRFAGDAPFCEALGYTLLDRDGQAFSREIARMAERVGIAPRDAEAVIANAKAREAREVQAARDRVQSGLADASGDRALREFADSLAVRCGRAAADPIATVMLKPPLGRDASISRRYVDGLLAPYRRAGWQSEYVLAGGDLAEAIGACEARLPQAQSRAYLADLRNPLHYPPDINDTIQDWLRQRVSAGRDNAKRAPPSAAQCRQLVARRKAALNKAPVD